jgi:hypothetical protein
MSSADQVTIRVATLAVARDLASMHVASWHETYAGMLPAETLASLSVDARTEMWTKIWENQQRHPPQLSTSRNSKAESLALAHVVHNERRCKGESLRRRN